jgi:hypothetical protein
VSRRYGILPNYIIKIKLLNSFPCYAQANGQAESSNKTLSINKRYDIDETEIEKLHIYILLTDPFQ